MKRLKYYLEQMKGVKTNFSAIYEGECVLASNLNERSYDPTYWNDEVSFTFARLHKTKPDAPVVEVAIPAKMLGISNCGVAAADFCLRAFIPYIERLNAELYNRARPDEENGKYYIYHPGSVVLQRTASFFRKREPKGYVVRKSNIIADVPCDGGAQDVLVITLNIQLPARNIKKAIKMLTRDLPSAVEQFILEFDSGKLRMAEELYEKQQEMREWLKNNGYCAFIANGSVLPRGKDGGAKRTAKPFISPKTLEIEVCGIKGMGIKCGVTVITGGGYSGKSTMLESIGCGVYNHILNDGREYVLTESSAVNIRTEDGRPIHNIDISPFITNIPNSDTKNFCTKQSSGSTSQAANVIEAIRCGCRLLLFDEDDSAANFMVKDSKMREIIKNDAIIPFTDRAQELCRSFDASTIIVAGASSEFLPVANLVLKMEDFVPKDITSSLFEPTARERENYYDEIDISSGKTYIASGTFSTYPASSGTERVVIDEPRVLRFGDDTALCGRIKNIVSVEQLIGIGFFLREIALQKRYAKVGVKKAVDELYEKVLDEGLETIYTNFFSMPSCWIEMPRIYEIYAVLNRFNNIEFI
ncbi:MAG: ABC-ATPase domain-containing protein [Clostridia bacterium]|nr:ABC-ATPase domain-containing protein [Clostridia bacterium]